VLLAIVEVKMDGHIENLVIPGFNGETYAGLAVVGDSRLPPNQRLKVVLHADLATCASMSAVATVTAWPFAAEPKQKALIAAAAYACVYYGLTGNLDGEVGNAGEYEVVEIATISAANVAATRALLTVENITFAVTLILATKINFWQMNHHVGSVGGSAFINKVMAMLLGTAAIPEDITVAHSFGHWCSTHVVFEIIGIVTRIEVAPIVAGAEVNRARIHITDDFKLRIQGMPAGAAKHGLCHAFVKKYSSTAPFALIPRANLLRAVCEEVEHLLRDYDDFKQYGFWGQDDDYMDAYDPDRHGEEEEEEEEDIAVATGTSRKRAKGGKVKGKGKKRRPDPDNLDMRYRQDPRIFYHMGAGFISGNRQARREFNSPEQLGIIGSVLRFNFSNHSMTKSPHIMIGNTPTYTGYESFDSAFDDLMSRVAMASVQLDDSEAKRIMGVSNSRIMSRDDYVYFRVNAGFGAEEAGEAYDTYADRAAAAGPAGGMDPGIAALVALLQQNRGNPPGGNP
jgi:hypothetical protein